MALPSSSSSGAGSGSGSGLAKFLQRLSPGFQSSNQPLSPASIANTLPVGVVVSTGDEVHEREDVLNQIDDEYYEKDFDAIDRELGSLSLTKNASAELNGVAEARSLALDCISDTLSMSILRDYDRFEQALNCVTAVRDAVSAAKTSAKVSREHLARCSLEISQGVKTWKNAQKKKNIAKTLEMLEKMQTAVRLLASVEDALCEARYGDAVEQCLAVGEIVSAELAPHGINAADVLSGEANRLLCDIADQMFASLSSMTGGQFDEETYANLMLGYVQLTDPEKIVGGSDLSPSEDIVSAFTAAPYDKVKRVVAGVSAAAGGGLAEPSDSRGLVELMANVPADAFKMCLQMVLKVEFDVLMSFRRLERWHDEQAGSQARDDKDSNDDKEGDDGDHEMKSGHGAEMLETIRKSLPRTKRLLWNEVSGSLMTVLQSIKPGHGESFVVVSTWVRDFLRVGKAFSGDDSEGLEAILSHQSVRFFKGHHINCIEALLTVLERETYGEVDIVLPWTSGEEQARQTQVSTSAAVDLDDCVARSSNPWDDRGDRGDPGDGYDHIGGDEGPGPSAPPTHHFDIKTAFRDHNITLGDGRQVSTTNSFWRLVKWIMEYVSLMHDLPSAAPAIAAGLVELVSIYLLHIYASFMGAKHGCMDPWYASKPLGEFVSTAVGPAPGGIGTYAPAVEAWFPDSPLVSLLRDDLASEGSGSGTGTRTRTGSSSMGLHQVGRGSLGKSSKSFSAKRGGAQSVCNSGNLYGLIERAVSVRTMEQLASLLQQLCDSLIGEGGGNTSQTSLSAGTPAPDATSAPSKLRHIVGIIPDMHRALYGTCCALLLPTAWIPDAVAHGDNGAYMATDPPLAAAPWTARLARQLELLAAQLAASMFTDDNGGADADTRNARIPDEDLQLLWSFVYPAVSHAIVDGLAAVKKCTLEGRAAMSLDLQAVSKSLIHAASFGRATTGTTEPTGTIQTAGTVGTTGQRLADRDTLQSAANRAIRHIDDYIKAFYVPIPDLGAWAASHPDYSTAQILAVAKCAADSLNPGDRNARDDLAQLAASLS